MLKPGAEFATLFCVAGFTFSSLSLTFVTDSNIFSPELSLYKKLKFDGVSGMGWIQMQILHIVFKVSLQFKTLVVEIVIRGKDIEGFLGG